MPTPVQRLTTQRQLFCGSEPLASEGVEVFGTSTDVLSVLNLAVVPDLAFYPRQFVGQLGTVTGKTGAKTDPGLIFTVQARGGGSGVTNLRLDKLLSVVLSPATPDGGSATVQTGGTAPTYNVSDASGFTAGNAVGFETGSVGSGVYEVGWIEATVTGGGQNSITLTHALVNTPPVGGNVTPSITYMPKNSGHASLSFQMYLEPGTSNDRVSFVGCKGTMKLDVPAPGSPPYLTFLFRAMDWFDSNGHAYPGATFDSAVPPSSYQLKLDANAFGVKLASWDLRQTVARKYSQNSAAGTASEIVTDRNLMGLLQVYDVDSGVEFSNWTNASGSVEQAVAQQFGTSVNNMVAYQIPKAQRTRVSYGDDQGLTTDLSIFTGNITNGADEIRLAFL